MNNKKAGGIIVRPDGKICLIWHKLGGYAFAKGKLERGESFETAALREVREETGYKARILGELGTIIRPANSNSEEVEIRMYVMVAIGGPHPNIAEWDERHMWVTIDQALEGMCTKRFKVFLHQHREKLESYIAYVSSEPTRPQACAQT